MSRHILAAIAAGALLACALAGCSPNTVTPPTPQPTLPFPDSADALMANLMVAYEGMNADWYAQVLHPRYRFDFATADATMLNLLYGHFSRAQELRAAASMFSGETLAMPDGSSIPGVARIDVVMLQQASAWVDTGPYDAEFPNTWRALFNVALDIDRVENATTFRIRGQQEFYLSRRDSVAGGVARNFYQLRGQRDRTGVAVGKGTEFTSWGSVKALYR